MDIKDFLHNKRVIASFIFIFIITIILTVYIISSYARYVLEKEVKFNLEIIESDEWNKRTLIRGEELNSILTSTGATRVVFGQEDKYSTVISGINGTAVGVADTNKAFVADDIKLYVIIDTNNIKTAYILSKYKIKLNADSSKMFLNNSQLTDVFFANIETTIVENLDSMFYGCSNLEEIDLYKFDTPKVTNISNMFNNCTSLKTIYVCELWSLSGITSAQENVFLNCTKLVGGNKSTYDKTKVSSDYACIDIEGRFGYFTYKSRDAEEPVVMSLPKTETMENTIANTVNKTNTTNTTNTVNTTNTTNTTNTANVTNTTNVVTNTTNVVNTTNVTNTTNTIDTTNTTNTVNEINTTNTVTVVNEVEKEIVEEEKSEEESNEEQVEEIIEDDIVENIITE